MKKSITPVHAFLAAAVLGLVLMPLAFAGAEPGASKSVVTDAKFKKLKKRVAAVEGKTAVAGGDLTGTYPNPEIKAAAVGSSELAAQSVTSGKFFANQPFDFDFGAGVAGTCAEFPFTIAGVVATDEVIVTPPATQPDGMIVQAKTTTAANNVIMQQCAVEAYGDPPNGTYEFSIIR